MRNKWIIASVLIAILLVLCAASLFAIWQGFRVAATNDVRINLRTNHVKAEGLEEKMLSVDGPTSLTMNNDFGDISIESGADDRVYVKAEKTAWGINEADAQKALEDLKVIVEQNKNAISISVQQPEKINVFNSGPVGGSVKFTVIVPRETAVSVDSLNGDIVLSGTAGKADLQSDIGSLTISDVSGTLAARTNNGNITAQNITADEDVSLSSDFGNIFAQEISAASVTVDSTNGTLDLQDITVSGLLKAVSDFGSISLTNDKAASVEVSSTNGKVELENVNVARQVTIRDDFGDLTLIRVDASAYDLNTKNGKIKLDQAQGPITAHSDFGDVEVSNVENGTIDLTSINGAITFSGTLADGPHSLSSDFGNITLALPAESALNVDMQTEFGKITSDFEITVSGTLDNKHWVGKFNGGGEQLNVKTKNGNITINSK